MHATKQVTLIAATAALVGCATPYVAPTTGPTANVKYLALGIHGVQIWTYPSDSCGDPKQIGVPGLKNPILLTTVSTGKPIRQRYSFTGDKGEHCTIFGTLNPEAGRDYEIEFVFDSNRDKIRCWVAAYLMKKDNAGQASRSQVALETADRCIF